MGRSQRHKAVHQGVTSAGNKLPKQATVPTVTGTNTVGQTLTGTNGTFTPATGVTITRQWTRNGVPIAGATAATYVLQAADSGKTVRFLNIGKNRFGSRTITSAPRSIA